MVKFQNIKSPHVRESGFRNPGNLGLWNPKCWGLESGIQLTESGIQVPMTKNLESSTWNTESKEWDPEFKTVVEPLHGAILCCVTLLTFKTILLVIQHIGHIHDLTPSLFILYLQRYEFHKILRRNGHS